jgi:AcrR family transcriptional regulator
MTARAGAASRADRKSTNARTLRTRQALRHGLLTLMGRKQFERITIRDIAAAANVGYATFFRHHVSKEELLKEIAAEEVNLLLRLSLARVERADPDDPRSASLIICQHVNEHRAVWTALLNGGADSTIREQCIRLATDHSKVRSSEWLPSELGAAHGVCAVIEILAWWLRKPDTYPPAQIAGIIDRLVVTPLMADSAPRPAPAVPAE